MDVAVIDAARAKPLDEEFQRIAAISDLPSLQTELARLHHFGVPQFYKAFACTEKSPLERPAIKRCRIW